MTLDIPGRLILVGLLSLQILCTAAQVNYDVTCSEKQMKVSILLNSTEPSVYLDRLKGFPGCQPKVTEGKVVVKLPLDNIHACGTTRMSNKYTGQTIFYHRIIIEYPSRRKEVLLVKCVLPGDKNRIILREQRPKRNVLPENFREPEYINITDYIEARAPIPYLNIAVRQNGRVLDSTFNVQPGTPLEMIIYLDPNSASTYGLLTSYLKVTDNSPNHDEIIIMNGCSIDPYIFGNFETGDDGKSLSAKFRAFKFPDSNYVLFVGTVNVCLQQCKGVPCGNDQFGYGKRRKREIPPELPFDPNKLFEVEMTTVLRVEYAPDHFKPKKGSIEGKFEQSPATNEVAAFTQESSAINLNSGFELLVLLTIAVALLTF